MCNKERSLTSCEVVRTPFVRLSVWSLYHSKVLRRGIFGDTAFAPFDVEVVFDIFAVGFPLESVSPVVFLFETPSVRERFLNPLTSTYRNAVCDNCRGEVVTSATNELFLLSLCFFSHFEPSSVGQN